MSEVVHNLVDKLIEMDESKKVQKSERKATDWIVRVGNGKNFNILSKFNIWGGVFPKDPFVLPGDRLWFVKSKSDGLILAVATLIKMEERKAGPLTEISFPQGKLDGKEKKYTILVHFKDLCQLEESKILTNAKSPFPFLKYQGKLNLSSIYDNILTKSSVKQVVAKPIVKQEVKPVVKTIVAKPIVKQEIVKPIVYPIFNQKIDKQEVHKPIVKQEVANPIPSDWIIRVGNGHNFNLGSNSKIWGFDSKMAAHFSNELSFSWDVKAGDRIWFIKRKSNGRLLGVATFDSLHDLKSSSLDKRKSWDGSEENWDKIIHYTNFFYLKDCGKLMTGVKTPAVIRPYSEKVCQINLPLMYQKILKYSKIKRSM